MKRCSTPARSRPGPDASPAGAIEQEPHAAFPASPILPFSLSPKPVSTFLSLDVGNSAVKGGVFTDGVLERVFHVEVSLNDPGGEAAGDTWTRALRPHLRDTRVDAVGMASVVPEVVPVACQAVRDLTGSEVQVVDAEMPLPFNLAYETPQTLGADRLAAAAAAWRLYGVREPPQTTPSGASSANASSAGAPSADAPADRSVIAVDAGTAVTYEVIDASGTYRGGAIAAGPVLIQRTLRSGTAQLPTVPLVFPESPIGTSTRDAMQSGIMWSFVDSVRGMTKRLRAVLPDEPILLLTGGWSSVLAEHLEHVDVVAPHLVLEGVRVLVDGE